MGTGVFKAKTRSHIGIVREKLMILPEMEKLESKRRRRWNANDFRVTRPRIGVTGRSLLSESQSSLLHCPHILSNSCMNEAASRAGEGLELVLLLLQSEL